MRRTVLAFSAVVTVAACGGPSVLKDEATTCGSGTEVRNGPCVVADASLDRTEPDAGTSSEAGHPTEGAAGDGAARDAAATDSAAADSAAPLDSGAHEAGATDAASEADVGSVDLGAPSSTYPAFAPDFGTLVDVGGYVMHAPVIVPITWDSDPSQATFDSFADGLGASAYWEAITKDYAVGAASSGSGNHGHLATAAPATFSETWDANSDFVKLIAANAGTAWPAPTRDTLYAFFLPPRTSLLVNLAGTGAPTDACSQGLGGYHSAVVATAAGASEMAYAVVASCSFGGGLTPEQWSTTVMSHEVIEAATDPFFNDPNPPSQGWNGFDDAHFSFDYFQELQMEVGDACEAYVESFFQGDLSFPYRLQRIWSNSSALAGHHPCVPVPAGAYFNVTPLSLGSVNVAIPAAVTGSGVARTLTARGLRVLAGSSGTLTVGFYSDGPTRGPWTLSATPGNPLFAAGGGDRLGQFNPSSITATIDKPSGVNGEKAHVTVSVSSTGSMFQGELLTLTSTLAGVSHYMPIWIAGE